MKTVLAFVALFGSALAHWRSEIRNEQFDSLDLGSAFEEFKRDFDMQYTADEEMKRFAIFSQTLKDIAKFNSEEHSSRVRANQFTALTHEEFKLKMFGPSGSCLKKGEDINTIDERSLVRDGGLDAPKAGGSDWTAKGCVTSVKSQKQCGSCWAFGTTGAIECMEAVQQWGGDRCLEKPVALSEQELVDCDWLDFGCNGGFASNGMRYAALHGLCSNAEYPYMAVGGSCQRGQCTEKHNIGSWARVPGKNEAEMRAALDKTCVTVTIEADDFAFEYYSSGVMSETCGANTDHVVLATGYGTDNGKDYWRVKNSWDTSWGENGYIRMCRNCGKNNGQGQCAILSSPLYPYLIHE